MTLRYLFVDMNSYFSSVEQQLRPELRGRPVGVVPMVVDSTCCIAVSREGKAFGVKTGTLVSEARRLCPGMVFVEARPELYIKMHHRLLEVIESCIHIDKVHSIDELSCRLTGPDQAEPRALAIAGQIKQALWMRVGRCMTCSIGLAPNQLLAKIGSDMQKPDGLTVIREAELPGRLWPLSLTDLPGIGRRMETRLRAAGITEVRQLCEISLDEMCRVWGSRVLGEMWWKRLRGVDVVERETTRRSVGHSQVLPPSMRNGDDAYAVLTCLLHKAAIRMRQMGYVAGAMTVDIRYTDGRGFDRRVDVGGCRDTLSLIRALGPAWAARAPGTPMKVGVSLSGLSAVGSETGALFEENRKLERLADAMDSVNKRFGGHKVFFGGMHGRADRDKTRIAFTRIPELSGDETQELDQTA